ncbi:MAG: pyrroline-5-carboxylate reductase [Bdellovibrionaceae bacterium]|nr:pyrroline-5-carboxylate reductase [Pseudobdellovibrionaceae bacterium]MDW8191270.1 pyrroline-5-carboxylate reductase [Pseudobdellovibrionaceae bacterium]
MIYRKLGFIGSGNITHAIIKGLIQKAQFDPGKIYVTNRSNQKAYRLAQLFGVNALNSNEALVENSDIIFLAVKPQDFSTLIDEVRGSLSPQQAVVSLIAGISIESLQKKLNCEHVARIVPNTAVSIGSGVIGIYSSQNYLREFLHRLFQPLGTCVTLQNEDLINSVLVATSSGLGFMLEMMSYYCDWLASHGFSDSEARTMIQATMIGAGRLSCDNPQIDLETLISQIASKKGVTESGLKTLRSFEMDRLIRMSLDQAQQKTEELSRLV